MRTEAFAELDVRSDIWSQWHGQPPKWRVHRVFGPGDIYFTVCFCWYINGVRLLRENL